MGGNTFVLLQVRRTWLLFKGPIAAQWLGHAPRAQLERLALGNWQQGIDTKQLIELITFDRNQDD